MLSESQTFLFNCNLLLYSLFYSKLSVLLHENQHSQLKLRSGAPDVMPQFRIASTTIKTHEFPTPDFGKIVFYSPFFCWHFAGFWRNLRSNLAWYGPRINRPRSKRGILHQRQRRPCRNFYISADRTLNEHPPADRTFNGNSTVASS